MKKSFANSAGQQVIYRLWSAREPRVAVVIAHGMVEHPGRYQDLASYLNRNGVSVYAICHIGHGEDARLLNHLGKGDFDRCISNLHELVSLARRETGKPVVLLGHSMGSFMSQLYVTRYDDLDALILSGSTRSDALAKSGAVLAKLLNTLSRDKTKPSTFMNHLAFGSYNKAFPNPRTDFDWLSRDEAQVDRYVADPYCGGICSISFYANLLGGMAAMGKKKYTAKINQSLPIYIQGGGDDPVSGMGKGLTALKKQYEDLGIHTVELSIYPGARHEIFNEINKEEVYRNTLSFIESILSGKEGKPCMTY